MVDRAVPPRNVVVMGVAGTGKSTVGALLADLLDVPFADADDFHSAANRAAMHAGQPLADADRWPWLQAVADWMSGHAATGFVIACSALKHAYRDRLRAAVPNVWFAPGG